MNGRLIFAVLALCAAARTTHAPDDDERALTALRAAFMRAYDAGDSATIAGLYIPDAVRMPYDAPAKTGSVAVAADLASQFRTRRFTPTLTLFADELHVSGEWALERGRYHEVQTPKASPANVRAEDGKYVAVYRRASSGWRFAWSIFNRDAPARPAAAPDTAMRAIALGTYAWTPNANGVAFAELENGLGADAQYTLAARLGDGRWIAPHWHAAPKRVLVLSGTLLVGHGATLDSTHVESYGPGSWISVPANMVHYEGGRGETVIVMYAVGPMRTVFVK
jgi:ketosteroid isomerase-like protein